MSKLEGKGGYRGNFLVTDTVTLFSLSKEINPYFFE